MNLLSSALVRAVFSTVLSFSLAEPNLPWIDQIVDMEDLSHIKSWAALGDSYAAGIGAGKPLGSAIHHDDWLCSRFDHAYPYLLNQADNFGDGDRDFKFLACSGWTSAQIKENQVPQLADQSQQLITLSAAGNDVYLSDLLDAYVYQVSPGAASSDKYQTTIDRTSDAIDNLLGGWLEDLYNALKPKLTDDGKIYQTGYAQFWISATDQCDDISWGIWRLSRLARPELLTRKNRSQMNDLALRVNAKIKEIIEKHHADKIVFFVDIDPYVRLLQGRFCEPAIQEPAPNRPGLLFYNRYTSDGDDDLWPHGELKRSGEQMANTSFEGQIALKFEEALKEHPDWKLSPDSPQSSGIGQDPVAGTDSSTNGLQDLVTTLLPDTFKRTFHPRPYLHDLMAQLVLWNIIDDRAMLMGRQPALQWFQSDKLTEGSCGLGARGPLRDRECFSKPWGAPKDTTDDGSTSVFDAITSFCEKCGSQTAEKGKDHEHIYDRWDISGWGVSKRQSLWLRASSEPFDQCAKGTIDESDCESILREGLNECDKNSYYSFGFKAQGYNRMEYSIDTSASIHEGDPPWDQHVIMFPPPEDAPGYEGKQNEPACRPGVPNAPTIKQNGAYIAIDQYCNNQADFEKEEYSQRAWQARVEVDNTFLSIWVTTIKNIDGPGGTDWTPVQDMGYCDNGFDWKKNFDDCRYALRKLINKCNPNLENYNSPFVGGTFTYRCATWNIAPGINCANCDVLCFPEKMVSKRANNGSRDENGFLEEGLDVFLCKGAGS